MEASEAGTPPITGDAGADVGAPPPEAPPTPDPAPAPPAPAPNPGPPAPPTPEQAAEEAVAQAASLEAESEADAQASATEAHSASEQVAEAAQDIADLKAQVHNEGVGAPATAASGDPSPEQAPVATALQQTITGDPGLGEQQPNQPGGNVADQVTATSAPPPEAQSGVPLPEDRAAGVQPGTPGMIAPGLPDLPPAG